MSRYLTIIVFVYINTINIGLTFKLNHYHSYQLNKLYDLKSTVILYAKKKTNKLISDELWTSLEPEDEDKAQVVSSAAVVDTNDNNNSNVKSKTKKQSKQLISSDLLSSFIEVDNNSVKVNNDDDNQGAASSSSTTSTVVIDKKKKKDKNKNKEDVFVSDDNNNDDDDNKYDMDVQSASSSSATIVEDSKDSELTLEQKTRKEKPSARVRFIESSQPDFVSIGLENVGLMYGNDVILKSATFSISTGERVGLVGPNGGGKSTSLKILAGEIEPTTGDILKSSTNLRIAFLKQEFIETLNLQNTLKDELLSSFIEEINILNDIEKYQKQIELTINNPNEMEDVLNQLSKLQELAISKNVYSLDSKVLKVMDSMGFSIDDGNLLVSSFSGGWKMRIGLAKILLLDPNILFLDEPTNHMDLDSVIWLESFLIKQNIPMLVVSHDREFLDKVCNKIIDVEDGKTISYKGNYSNFLEQRKLRLIEWREKYEKQQRYIKDEIKWIQKAKNDLNMAQQVKSRENLLEKFKLNDDYVDEPPRERKFRFRFPPAPRCGEIVIEASKLTHGYGHGKYQTLFKDINFFVERGNRIGFIGPNGSGKSTLMRIIGGLEEPNSGYSEYGSSNVISNYYAQNQADVLNLDDTILETLQKSASSEISLTEIRTLLGQFMFKGDDVDKKIKVLSGGEKARVALCKLMLEPANLLLLDEPTNHLDITSKEVLEDALLNYSGSVLIISHDRYFMSQVVNTIFSFQNQNIERFDGDYHDFMEKDAENDGKLKDKIISRYVSGDKYKITNAKECILPPEETKNKSKNFGGSGVTSGNLFKGIKNAKRFSGK